MSLSLSQFVEIHKLHPKLSYIWAFFNPKFDVCSGENSQTSWLCFRYFEFVPGMVRPYSNPDLHRKLVLDYAKVCSKMKAWQFEHSNVRLDWLGINTRSVYIYTYTHYIYTYTHYIYIPYTILQLGYDLSHQNDRWPKLRGGLDLGPLCQDPCRGGSGGLKKGEIMFTCDIHH